MIGESVSSNNYSQIRESSDKRIKWYVDNQKGGSKLTCLIHDPGHSSYECKVVGDLGSKYSKSRCTQYCRHEPTTQRKFGRQQQKNAIVQHALNDIILQDNNKLSGEYEEHGNIYSEMYENNLYDIYNTSLNENK